MKGVRLGTKLTCGQTVVIVHSLHADRFCSILFVRMFIVHMTLREKTQNGVLGQSARVPCEVASSLRSHL